MQRPKNPLLAVFLVLTVALLSSTASAEGSCHLITPGSELPAGFGAPYDLATGDLLLQAHCEETSADVTLGTGTEIQYVYRFGHEWRDNAWQQIEYEGEGPLVDDAWYVGQAQTSLPRTAADMQSTNFFLGYICTWRNKRWYCGCRDSSCTQEYWQIQAFTYTPPPPSTEMPTQPEPPKNYSVPSGAIRVTNSTELKKALAGSSARDIVLANGTYDNSSVFDPAAPHRLWAENLGGATLTAGILFNSGEGAEVHGIRFNVSTTSKGSESSIIRSTGSGHRVTITDSWLEGNGVMRRGILMRAINGPVIQRLFIRNFQNDGIRITDYPNTATPNPAPILTDLDIANIKDNDPDCCNGTSEHGIALHSSSKGGRVERVKVRNTDWSCVLPGHRSHDTLWRDLDLDGCKVAFYLEHKANGNTIERFTIGPNVQTGITFEGGAARYNYDSIHDTMIQDGIIDSTRAGVNISLCNAHNTVQRVIFRNQCWAAIGNSAAQSNAGCDGSAGGTNKFLDNDYSGIDAGAKEVTTAHANTAKCG